MRRDGEREHRETAGFSKKRLPTLADDLDFLMGQLCRHWGFCNWLRGADLLGGDGAVTADAFAEQVLLAEKMDPAIEVKWRRAMVRVFVERYGRTAVSVHTYSLSDG